MDNAGELKKTISTILVANDKDLRPYIELFEYTGENIIQQQLGTLLGTFEIQDDSKDSAYIVNFLTSVAKKEYFVNPKRSAAESFEAALHKVNLALSELANHGNVSWLGKLDAAICVLESNYFHFSVAGNAKVLLLRNNTITDISEDLASDKSESHPIKTFINISSGNLEKDDKLIITGEDLFHVFSLTEIKKGSSHFDNEKFVQFIKTALVNELEIAGTIIIDVFKEQLEAKQTDEKPKSKKKGIFNAFSEKSFRDSASKSPIIIPADDKKKKKEYIDKKTGHIYVKGEYYRRGESNFFNNLLFIAKEGLVDLTYWVKTKTEKINIEIKKRFKELKGIIVEKKIEIKEKLKKEEAGEMIESLPEAGNNKLQDKLKYFYFKIKKFIRNISYSNLLPDFSRIKNGITNMDYQQRVYAILILTAIIFLPLIWVKYQNSKQLILPQKELAVTLTPAEIFAQDKNINLDVQTQVLYSGENIIDLALSNDISFAITKDKLIKIKNDQEMEEFFLPENSGKITASAPMKDLGLIFLLTDQNKIISFSSVSEKFQENSISIPENSKIKLLATYLTYIYLIDTQNNQIYRYPRAEGGFEEKTDWLKENIDLQNVSDIAIDENIYLANGNQIVKLFSGTREEFNIEQSATTIKSSNIFTDIDTENIYILDSTNGRIVKYGKNGELISQYYNEVLKNAKGITVDEKNNKAYFITSQNLISLDL